MFLLCKHVRLTCVFNKLMMMMMQKSIAYFGSYRTLRSFAFICGSSFVSGVLCGFFYGVSSVLRDVSELLCGLLRFFVVICRPLQCFGSPLRSFVVLCGPFAMFLGSFAVLCPLRCFGAPLRSFVVLCGV